jgi:ATP/ADP translocase
MFSRILYLEPGQLRRGLPFFALYLLLFAALTLADGLSLTLFVQHVGAAELPRYYGISALCVLFAVGAYLQWAERIGSGRVFAAIIIGPMVLLALVWCAVYLCGASREWLGLLFMAREISFALVLLHFGTYLQDYFTRAELNRVMPIIYAGGRVGGIAGGALLEHLSAVVHPAHLLLVAAGMLALGLVGVSWIGRRVVTVDEPPIAATRESNSATAERTTMEAAALNSPRDFLRFVWANPLMFWITATTIFYFMCRTFLNFRYSQFFEGAFADDVAMAAFLGRYTQWALLGSLLLQLLIINRWINRVGLAGAHLTYAVLLCAAALLGGLEMTLASAQLIVNQFSKAMRIRARAWSLGLLIPLSTCAASIMLAGLGEVGWLSWAGILTAVWGVVYLLSSWGLVRGLNGYVASPVKPARAII